MTVCLWPTLQKVFTIFGLWLTDTFFEKNNLCNVVLTTLGQHSIGILSRQCCLNTSRQHCTKKNYLERWMVYSYCFEKLYIVCLLAQRTFGNKFIRATLYRVVTYSMSILFNFISYMFFIFFQGQKKTPEILGFYYIHQPTDPMTQ